MIWNCNGEVRVITFICSTAFQDPYCCCIGSYVYVLGKGIYNAGDCDWYREGYTIELAGWVETK